MAPQPTLTLEEQAAEAVRAALAHGAALAVVSGSGLGVLRTLGREIATLDFSAIPGLGASRVAGHAGLWSLLETGAGRLYCLSGRRHAYEGLAPAATGFAMRVLARLGVRRVILTNAAGGISPRLRVGDLMLIRDHLNMMFCNPLSGRGELGAARIPVPIVPRSEREERSEIYDPAINARLREAALAEGIALQEGIYASVRGPSYETRAEVALLRRLGADAVGMSTVPEALVAHAAGLRVAALSLITNSHVQSGPPPSHEEVLAAARQSGQRLKRLLARAIMEELRIAD